VESGGWRAVSFVFHKFFLGSFGKITIFSGFPAGWNRGGNAKYRGSVFGGVAHSGFDGSMTRYREPDKLLI
jgi:hypothetical protein